MKKIMIMIVFIIFMPLHVNAADLVDIAKKELYFSKNFLKYERHQRKKLYAYVKLVKARYVSSKELVWVSNKIVDAIYLQSSMIRIIKE